MNLIYRGLALNYYPTTVQSRLSPRTVNWRFQTAQQLQSELPQTYLYKLPQAINWRFQITG